MILIVMGVSGSGKTTVGRMLARRLGWEFLDADDFHSPANVAKMRAGSPLNDADRAGWLEQLRAAIADRLTHRRPAVLACSALRQIYRDQLARPGEDITFIYLRGDFATIHERISARRGHYMAPSLLHSQFATLEEPTDAIVVPVELPPAEAAAKIVRELGLDSARVPTS